MIKFINPEGLAINNPDVLGLINSFALLCGYEDNDIAMLEDGTLYAYEKGNENKIFFVIGNRYIVVSFDEKGNYIVNSFLYEDGKIINEIVNNYYILKEYCADDQIVIFDIFKKRYLSIFKSFKDAFGRSTFSYKVTQSYKGRVVDVEAIYVIDGNENSDINELIPDYYIFSDQYALFNRTFYTKTDYYAKISANFVNDRDLYDTITFKEFGYDKMSTHESIDLQKSPEIVRFFKTSKDGFYHSSIDVSFKKPYKLGHIEKMLEKKQFDMNIPEIAIKIFNKDIDNTEYEELVDSFQKEDDISYVKLEKVIN